MGTKLYLATSKGVLTVEPEAGGWQIGQRGLGQWGITEVAVDPRDVNRIYAGTRGDGVLVSADGGETWSKPNRGKTGPGKVRCVTIDPHDPDTIWAGGEPIAIWRSEDCGQSWQALESVWSVPGMPSVDYPVDAVEPHIRDIVVDKDNANTVYASIQVGYMIKSTDRGATWALLDKGLDADVHTITQSPADSRSVYLATGGHDNRLGIAPGRALYRSTDAGATWSPMAMEFSQEYSVPLVARPDRPTVLFSALAEGNPGQWIKRDGGSRGSLIRSTDGGETWHALDAGNAVIEGFAEAIAIDPGEPDAVFVATRQGKLLASADGGDSWTDTGLEIPAVADMKAVHV